MRLSEDKIKEAILYPDLDVRDAAIRYFYSSTTPDHFLMPLAIEAIEKYGRTKAFSYTHYLNLLPQTDQTIAWVMAELQHDCDALPEEKYFYYYNLSRLLTHANIRLVEQRADEILQAPHFDGKEKRAFRERLEMFGWNAEKCWQELLRHCEVNRDKKNIQEFDLGYPLRIIEALARQKHEYDGQIVALLAQKIHDFCQGPSQWLQPMMANLAGKMRLQSASPVLVGNLGHPQSFLSDQSMFALIQIGSEEVVALVCDQFPRASWDFRLYASDLLGKMHLDATIKCVQELLPDETGLLVRTNLCEALLAHFSFDAIEPARELLLQNELTPDLRHLRSNLIAYCKIMGTRFPEFDAWLAEGRRDAEDERAKMRELEKLVFETGGDLRQLAQRLTAQRAETQAETRRLKDEVAGVEQLLAIKSSPRRVAGSTKPGRIGRNDPCPCGSGKKFKNCCMK